MSVTVNQKPLKDIKRGKDTDKSDDYLGYYEEFFSKLRYQPIKLMELGVKHGSSLLLWAEYFGRGLIVGIDKKRARINNSDRVLVYEGLQQDIAFLGRVAAETAPEGFDIIIDDCSHIAEFTRKSFWYLFDNHLKGGGVYVIEDWGTGYWDSWPDGKRYLGSMHYSGMVGFIKDLVDECGAHDLTSQDYGISPVRSSKFQKLCIYPGIAFIVKNTNSDG